jgi:uncharacterized protein YndB with AHSA1/START domain
MTSDPASLVELQVRLGAAPDEVFRYLTDAERYVRWQGVKAELDPRPGGVFRVWMDADTVARGEFVEVEAPRRVVFSWGWEGNESVPPGSTIVELTLEADGDGTVLSLRHTGLPDGEAAAMHEEGWRFFTARLAAVARGEDPGPTPPDPMPAP